MYRINRTISKSCLWYLLLVPLCFGLRVDEEYVLRFQIRVRQLVVMKKLNSIA